MNLPFRAKPTLAVFGPGLLGGSLLLEARALGFARVQAWARREAGAAALLARGLADSAGSDAAAAATGADLVVLCTPVEAMPGLARELAPVLAGSGAVVTDVGSVKGMVMREVAPVFAAAGVAFVGSHPMAGSEAGGLEAARRGLYAGAACILTQGEAPDQAVAAVRTFWEALGSVVTEMDAAAHDHIVARISHLPHAAAVVAALAALRPDPEAARFAAGGLRDTTRVAGGNPELWRGILLNNREAVLPALRDLQRETERMVRCLEDGDAEALESLLSEARDLRRACHFPPAAAPA